MGNGDIGFNVEQSAEIVLILMHAYPNFNFPSSHNFIFPPPLGHSEAEGRRGERKTFWPSAELWSHSAEFFIPSPTKNFRPFCGHITNFLLNHCDHKIGRNFFRRRNAEFRFMWPLRFSGKRRTEIECNSVVAKRRSGHNKIWEFFRSFN
jgi:hypothetical protein